MAGKLALVFILIHSIQILALPTPSTPIASKSLASYNKRYYFPETLPDQDELEAILKETAMREAGFVHSSIPSNTESGPVHKMETELQKSLPNPDAAIGTAPAIPDSTQDTKPKQSQFQPGLKQSLVTLESDDYPIYWPPFGFFVVSAAIVCFFTILRGIRAKK
ncbi:hypothetical protein N7447_002915 [Penicillium robsamsonii]|uniref:uncharacterized protein n=1 Tax=Penicillium robsamsonii TaxID=1792511 RepID=UPI002549921E|nr:uncharacterized protein N7447_002915 [Penicillium robsamsonii]KAJ5836889.1 hypothetical protein N7447_002915 [Penicillium robsamsonii]